MCEITMKAIGTTYAKKLCDGNRLYVDLGFDLRSRCPSLTGWDQTSEVLLSRDALKSNFRGSSQSRRFEIKLQRFLSVETPWNQTSEVPLSRDALESNFRASVKSRRFGIKLHMYLSVESPFLSVEPPTSRDAL